MTPAEEAAAAVYKSIYGGDSRWTGKQKIIAAAITEAYAAREAAAAKVVAACQAEYEFLHSLAREFRSNREFAYAEQLEIRATLMMIAIAGYKQAAVKEWEQA